MASQHLKYTVHFTPSISISSCHYQVSRFDVVFAEQLFKLSISQKQENIGIPGVEVIPVTPRKTEVTENVSLVQKIYEENKVSQIVESVGTTFLILLY